MQFPTLSALLSKLTGMEVRSIWTAVTQSSVGFNQVVARKNIIRAVKLPLGTGITPVGLEFERCDALIADSNVINDTASQNGVRFSNCDSTKFFNNQTTAGQLLRGVNTVTGKAVLELEDSVQDVLLPL